MAYNPPQEILDKYADVLVNFALNSGKGVKKGEAVLLQVDERAKPILESLRRAVLKAEAHSIIQFVPNDFAREFNKLAKEHNLNFLPKKYKVDALVPIHKTLLQNHSE